jgi:hypothetical protein
MTVPIWERVFSCFERGDRKADARARLSPADALSLMGKPLGRSHLRGKVIKGRLNTASLGKWSWFSDGSELRDKPRNSLPDGLALNGKLHKSLSDGLLLSHRLLGLGQAFNRMRSYGASLEELRMVGEIDLAYPASRRSTESRLRAQI